MKEAKELLWVGQSKRDLLEFPDKAIDKIGYALDMVQRGGIPNQAKPLQGFGEASVLELALDFDTDTYRAVYTVRFEERMYVLHCFQKKSSQGIKTSKQDLDLIGQRLKAAQEIHDQWQKQQQAQRPAEARQARASAAREQEEMTFELGSGNVYADLGYANPEEMLAKAQLTREISRSIESRGLSLTEAAVMTGVDDVALGELLEGLTRSFTVDRLSAMLTALDRSAC